MPSGWQLASQHVLTGVPENDWTLRLDPRRVPRLRAGRPGPVLRAGLRFQRRLPGPLGDAATRWLGQPAREWFAARGLKPEDCGIDPQADIHSCPLFPVLAAGELEPAFVEWLFAPAPGAGDRLRPPLARACPGSPRSRFPSRSTCAASMSSARGCARPACCRCSRTSAGASSSGSTSKPPRAPLPPARDALPELHFERARRSDAVGARPDVPLRRAAASP